MRRAYLAAVVLLLSTPHPASAQPMGEAAGHVSVIHPWQELSGSLAESVQPHSLVLYGAALAATPPLVLWADRPVQDYFQRHDPLTDAFGIAGLWVGGTMPLVLPAGLYAGGLLADQAELATAGAAALQAGALQLIVVHALKWLTDRAGPFPDGDPSKRRWNSEFVRDSDDPAAFNFNPFDLTWGLRYPSGHTASNVAMVAALSAFYPDESWIPALGYPFAAAIGIGMIEGDYHWLSDIVAGALIGHALGWAVGSHFRSAFDEQSRPAGATHESSPHLSMTPSIGPDTFVLSASGSF